MYVYIHIFSSLGKISIAIDFFPLREILDKLSTFSLGKLRENLSTFSLSLPFLFSADYAFVNPKITMLFQPVSHSFL